MRNYSSLFAIVLALGALFTPDSQAQTIWYVDDDATAAGNGTSWSTAYKYLQDAQTSVAGGDTIRVAGGFYTADRDQSGNVAQGDRFATFRLASGVALFGGYAGLANLANPDVRDFVAYESVLSGDLIGNDAPDFVGYGDNSYHVVTYDDPNATGVILDGFTVSGGMADGTGVIGVTSQGGAIHIRNGSAPCIAGGPTIRNCVIRDNWASNHGALNDHGLATKIENCTFEDNYAEVRGAALVIQSGDTTISDCVFSSNVALADGGAVWIGHDDDPTCAGAASTPRFVNCAFTLNRADHGASIYNEVAAPTIETSSFIENTVVPRAGGIIAGGGGLYNTLGGNATVLGCEFIRNTRLPGALDGYGGGIYSNKQSTVTVEDTLFDDNRMYKVGALFGKAATVVARNCTFTNNRSNVAGAIRHEGGTMTLVGCYLADNFAGGGGAIETTGGTMEVINCTFHRNGTGTSLGSAIVCYSGELGIVNSIFSDNVSYNETGTIHVYGGTLTMVNSTLVGNQFFGASSAAALYNESEAFVSNCVFWSNTNQNESRQINSPSGTLEVNHTLVQGLTGSLGGTGNIGDDPLFVDALGPDGIVGTEDDDLRVTAESPCIDGGNTAALPSDNYDLDGDGDTTEVIPLDVAGSFRILTSVVDMGAHEYPLAGAKHRYLTIDSTSFGQESVAMKVTLSSMRRCAGDLEQACIVEGDCDDGTSGPCVEHPDVGASWWVQAAQDEPLGCLPGPCGPTDQFARVDATPHFQVWDLTTLHIGDCEIVPVAIYEIQACVPPDGTVCGDVLTIGTIRQPALSPGFKGNYGDVAGTVSVGTGNFTAPDGVTNIVDVSAYQQTSQNYGTVNTPQVHPTWVDLNGLGAGQPPQYILNVGDLGQILKALQGATWTADPGNLNPGDCP